MLKDEFPDRQANSEKRRQPQRTDRQTGAYATIPALHFMNRLPGCCDAQNLFTCSAWAFLLWGFFTSDKTTSKHNETPKKHVGNLQKYTRLRLPKIVDSNPAGVFPVGDGCLNSVKRVAYYSLFQRQIAISIVFNNIFHFSVWITHKKSHTHYVAFSQTMPSLRKKKKNNIYNLIYIYIYKQEMII